MEEIYQRPSDYDLEHEGDEEDVAFYLSLVERWRPRRVIELASGSGRIAIPLAISGRRYTTSTLSKPTCATGTVTSPSI